MKSNLHDGETLGSLLLKTEKEHENSPPFEANELSHEMGKGYMKRLMDVVSFHRNKIDKYYIQVIYRRNPFDLIQKRARINIVFIARKSMPFMEDDMDLWFVDNKTDTLKLEWSLPHWSEFELFLNSKEKHSPKLISWIKKYKSIQK